MTRTKGSAHRNSLVLRASELAGSSAFLLYLAGVGSDRLSINQLTFFMLAAAADARGTPATLARIKEEGGEQLAQSTRNSYRVLLEPNRRYPDALGWLWKDQNPDDEREFYLRLTDKGREVVKSALDALQPITE